MTVTVGWGLLVALVVFVAIATVASRAAGLGLARAQAFAAVRAIVQLAAVSLVITVAVQSIWGALAFSAFMFSVGVWTTTSRVGARRAWPWTVVAMAAGVVPVLALVFVTGAAPLNGVSIVALGGIVIGNMMTGHTLAGRRCFAELRENRGIYEAALALGFTRRESIRRVLAPVVAEALIPNLDQTRTVGLVTLPGAFIGVLLGGGSPLQAGAAQVLVLIGVMAGQALTVTTAASLMERALLLPPDLAESLQP